MRDLFALPSKATSSMDSAATVTGNVQSQSLFDSLTANSLFTGGAGLMGIGLVLNYGRTAAKRGFSFLRRRFVSTLELNNDDQAFKWVLEFMIKNSKWKINQLSVNTELMMSESGKNLTSFNLVPGQGFHHLTYRGRWIRMERERKEQMLQTDSMRRVPLESVRLSAFGVTPYESAKFWKNLLEKASKEALSEIETGLAVYTAIGPSWHHFGKPRKKRPLDSVVLDAGVREGIQADLESFFTSQKWYTDRGIPYRRGYLFYGPPGTGKTSFISALAAHYGYNICMLSLSDRLMDDVRLTHLVNSAPAYSFMLLEDIENAFIKWELDNDKLPAYEGLTRVTRSGLLNAIDGVTSSEERVLFMTTNHIERLDSALIRPGRVDVKQHFGNCTPFMLEQLFAKFFEEVPRDMCIAFREAIVAQGIDFSPASIQGHLLKHKTDPNFAIRNIRQIIEKDEH